MLFLKIIFSGLKTNELLTLLNHIIQVSRSTVIDDVKFGSIIERLDELHDEFSRVTKKSLKSKHIKIVKELDDRRDMSYNCFKNVVKELKLSIRPDIVKDADKIWQVLETYDPNLEDVGFYSRTAKIHSIITVLSSMEMDSIIKVIGIDKLFDDLRTTHTNFETSIEDRAIEQMLKETLSILGEISDKIEYHLYIYTNYLYTSVTLSHNPDLKALIEKTNVHIKESNRIVSARRKKAIKMAT